MPGSLDMNLDERGKTARSGGSEEEAEAKKRRKHSGELGHSSAMDLDQEVPVHNPFKPSLLFLGHSGTGKFTIQDTVNALGHRTYVPKMISGASEADVGVLVISARKGEFET